MKTVSHFELCKMMQGTICQIHGNPQNTHPFTLHRDVTVYAVGIFHQEQIVVQAYPEWDIFEAPDLWRILITFGAAIDFIRMKHETHQHMQNQLIAYLSSPEYAVRQDAAKDLADHLKQLYPEITGEL